MLVRIAVCPHPPLLVPEVSQGAAAELDGLRLACDRAVAALLAAAPDLLAVVGAGGRTREHEPGTWGSLRSFGVPVDVRLGWPADRPASDPPARDPAAELPLSLTVGAWLLARTWPSDGPVVRGQEVAGDAPTSACAALGRSLAVAAARVAMLVLADGSARRGPQAPGYTDPRAVPLDQAVTAALAAGDAEALLAVPPTLAADVLMSGRAALQVLAGAARGRPWAGELLATDDRYGVAYSVATWAPAASV